MTEEIIRPLLQLRKELEGMNRTFHTNLNIDITDIKKKLTEEIKRETLGRTSYGLGV